MKWDGWMMVEVSRADVPNERGSEPWRTTIKSVQHAQPWKLIVHFSPCRRDAFERRTGVSSVYRCLRLLSAIRGCTKYGCFLLNVRG